MPLATGTRVGPYEIAGALGAGGMGEVYRARDTKLNREVAVKVVREAVAHNADRLTRFRRAAQTLAALNHSNVAATSEIDAPARLNALPIALLESEDVPTRRGERQ